MNCMAFSSFPMVQIKWCIHGICSKIKFAVNQPVISSNKKIYWLIAFFFSVFTLFILLIYRANNFQHKWFVILFSAYFVIAVCWIAAIKSTWKVSRTFTFFFSHSSSEHFRNSQLKNNKFSRNDIINQYSTRFDFKFEFLKSIVCLMWLKLTLKWCSNLRFRTNQQKKKCFSTFDLMFVCVCVYDSITLNGTRTQFAFNFKRNSLISVWESPISESDNQCNENILCFQILGLWNSIIIITN